MTSGVWQKSISLGSYSRFPGEADKGACSTFLCLLSLGGQQRSEAWRKEKPDWSLASKHFVLIDQWGQAAQLMRQRMGIWPVCIWLCLKYQGGCLWVLTESYMGGWFCAVSCFLEHKSVRGFLFFFFFNKSIYLFIFGCLGSSLLRRLSLVVVSRGYSSLWREGFSLQWLLLLRSMGSRRAGFSSCGTRALERRLSSCGIRA